MAETVTMWNEAGESVGVNADHPHFAAYREKWPLDAAPVGTGTDGAAQEKAKGPKKGQKAGVKGDA